MQTCRQRCTSSSSMEQSTAAEEPSGPRGSTSTQEARPFLPPRQTPTCTDPHTHHHHLVQTSSLVQPPEHFHLLDKYLTSVQQG